MGQRECQAIGPHPQETLSPATGVRNRAERGQQVSKQGFFPVSQLMWRHPRFAFPVFLVWLVASPGEWSFPEPGEGFRKFCFKYSSFIQQVNRTHRVLSPGSSSRWEIITCHYHRSLLQVVNISTFIHRFRFSSRPKWEQSVCFHVKYLFLHYCSVYSFLFFSLEKIQPRTIVRLQKLQSQAPWY